MPFPDGPILAESLGLAGDDDSMVIRRRFSWVSLCGRFKVVIEEGFVTDFASIPRIMWRIFGHPYQYKEESAPHDWLYQEFERHRYTRAQCDKFFRWKLEEQKHPLWKCWGMWLGVRLGGWIPWRRYRKQS